jgi:ABC-type proline/glycine betaine transport system permease subunit
MAEVMTNTLDEKEFVKEDFHVLTHELSVDLDAHLEILNDSFVNCSESDDDSSKLTPPNGGYGWVVVTAFFFLYAFGLSHFYTFGIFLVEYIGEFGTSLGTLSIIGSLATAMCTMLAAQVGKWSDKYGNNKISLLGGFVIR